MTTSWLHQLPSLQVVLNTRADDYAFWLDFLAAISLKYPGADTQPFLLTSLSFTPIHHGKKLSVALTTFSSINLVTFSAA